MDGLSKYIIWI